MTKEEEIKESIEFCNDIYVYLEKQDRRTEEEQYLPEYACELDVDPEAFEKKEKETENNIAGSALFFLFFLFAAFVCAKLLTAYVVQVTTVHGNSMESTVQNQNMLLVNKLQYYLNEPERFDIIVFSKDSNVNLIKRVIGLPGETVKVEKGKIYINGELLTENYGNEPMDTTQDTVTMTLEEDEYFVLGDNRNVSLDSRYESIGPVKKSEILGKAWFRFYPFTQWKEFG